jgi:hypothetical protein
MWWNPEHEIKWGGMFVEDLDHVAFLPCGILKIEGEAYWLNRIDPPTEYPTNRSPSK